MEVRVEIVRTINRGMLGLEKRKEGEVIVKLKEMPDEEKLERLEKRWELSTGAGGFVGAPDFWEILALLRKHAPEWEKVGWRLVEDVKINVPSLSKDEKEALEDAFFYYIKGHPKEGEKLSPYAWVTLQLLKFGPENGIIFKEAHVPEYRRTTPPVFILHSDGNILITTYHWLGDTDNSKEGWDWLERKGAVIFVPRPRQSPSPFPHRHR